MQIFLNHAKHNENFHVCICTNYADNFFDWKIIVSFYIAIHYLKALAAHKNIQLPSSHFAIDKMCDPKKAENALGLTHNAWDWYTLLYQCSRTARYDGFIDTDTNPDALSTQGRLFRTHRNLHTKHHAQQAPRVEIGQEYLSAYGTQNRQDKISLPT